MKLTAKTDVEVPAAHVYASLTDFPAWEREGARRGVEIEHAAGTSGAGVGKVWKLKALYRKKLRKITLRIDDLVENQKLGLHVDSPAAEGTTRLEIIVLSPRRSRLRLDLDLRPKTLAARLFINTMRLAKGRVQARLEARLGQLGARIKDTYDRNQK
jgi:Polyketide cyclase / dehydrase and lipid transport